MIPTKLLKQHRLPKNQTVAVTTSRTVAEVFGKRHADVIRDIENLTTQNCVLPSFFIESTYKSKQNKALKQYLITQDGFTLLAMGFTGSKALEFKLKYIQAFNEMREMLQRKSLAREVTRELYKGASAALKEELGVSKSI
jgi:Rha family phage regulatory protein